MKNNYKGVYRGPAYQGFALTNRTRTVVGWEVFHLWGDGVQDDTGTVQRMLDMAEKVSRRRKRRVPVFLKPGTYTVIRNLKIETDPRSLKQAWVSSQ